MFVYHHAYAETNSPSDPDQSYRTLDDKSTFNLYRLWQPRTRKPKMRHPQPWNTPSSPETSPTANAGAMRTHERKKEIPILS